jgi:hypothetical protein
VRPVNPQSGACYAFRPAGRLQWFIRDHIVSRRERQDARIDLTLPVKVVGYDTPGSAWEEMSTVEDVSARGAGFCLRRVVHTGQILHLTLPLPKRFRTHDLSEQSYRVYALVRTVQEIRDGRRVGVLFLGRQPPRNFDKDPAGIYLLPGDAAPAPTAGPAGPQRRHERRTVMVTLRLRRMVGGAPAEELTFAENIGRGGVRVLTTLPVGKDEVLMLEEFEGPFRTRAAVRNVWIGPDQVARLNLEFLDDQAPDRLVASGA